MANTKRDHGVLFDRLIAAIAGEKVKAPGDGGGPVNKKLMWAAIALITDWSPENRNRFLGYLQSFLTIGHMTLSGPKGIACEQASPGMHWSYSFAAILAVFLKVWERIKAAEKGGRDMAESAADRELYQACEDVLLGEFGLDRHYVFRGQVVLPCPRGKDEIQQPPYDAYRDAVVALGLGLTVKKDKDWWDDPLALAPRLMRELVTRGIWDSRLAAEARDADVPKLYLPIKRREIQGGWIAWIEDTPEARKAMGRDVLNWVRCGEKGITWGYDWEDVPAS